MRKFCYLCASPFSHSLSWNFFRLFRKLPSICTDCFAHFEKKEAPFCLICHQKTLFSPCFDCQERIKEKKAFLTMNRSLYRYNDFAATYMAKYKFQGDYILREVFSMELRHLIEAYSYDILTPIPLSKERLEERGFNQVEAVLKAASVPYQLLLRKKGTEKQSKQNRKERLIREQVFSFHSELCIQGKNILIVDDIYTTGATVHLAAKLLLEQGAKEIRSVTLFR